MNTHADTANAVLSGRTDAGSGAFHALGLGFVHLIREQFDLVIPTEALGLAPIGRVLEVIRSQEFKDKLLGMGGYATRDTGRQMNS